MERIIYFTIQNSWFKTSVSNNITVCIIIQNLLFVFLYNKLSLLLF